MDMPTRILFTLSAPSTIGSTKRCLMTEYPPPTPWTCRAGFFYAVSSLNAYPRGVLHHSTPWTVGLVSWCILRVCGKKVQTCVYIHMFICIYVCIYILTYTYIYTYIYMHCNRHCKLQPGCDIERCSAHPCPTPPCHLAQAIRSCGNGPTPRSASWPPGACQLTAEMYGKPRT